MTLRFKSLSLLLSVFSVAVISVFVFSPSTHAAIGGGGAPSGGGGSYWTSNGFGWYSYDVNSGVGPEAWSTGGPWAAVRAICISEGAPRVDAFIIQRPGGNNTGNNAKVYKWETSGYNTAWTGYKGNSGGNWLSVGAAQTHFNSIANPGSFEFGKNVAWFCYNPINFTMTPNITGTPKDIGGSTDNVQLTPTVSNSGPTASSDGVEWRVTTFRLNPGVTEPGANKGSAAPATYYGNINPTDIKISTKKFGVGTTNLQNELTKQSIGDYAVGTKICYGLSIRPYTHTSSNWSYSKPFCIMVTKKPKIQVLGSDVLAGRPFPGNVSQVSKITAGITNQAAKTETIPAPAAAFGGLWNTGVNDSGAKLGANARDPHWTLARIIPQTGAPTCQQVVNNSGALQSISSSGNSGISARTIVEGTSAGGNSAAGLGVAPGNGAVVGNQAYPIVYASGKNIWEQTVPNARWIGQNQYGQNFNNSNCKDPTYADTANYNKANIYVFRLTNGFTIDPSYAVNLNSVSMKITGGADNGVRFVVNGKYVDTGWQYPGWTYGASVSSSAAAGAGTFKNGNNTLEVYILSTYSHTGLLINSLTMSGTAEKKLANMYGSWAEYGVGATGQVSGLASASGLAGGVVSTSECAIALLTLANTARPSPSGCSSVSDLGTFDTKRTIPDIATRFPTSSSTATLTGTVDLGASNSQGLYKVNDAAGSIDLSATTLKPGQWVVINSPTKTVNITGNIKYTNGLLNGAGDIPQLVIIANRINIRSTVDRVDAWLIAKGAEGVVNTCRDASHASDNVNLSSAMCDVQLTVNGPVMAKKLALRRTGGAGAGTAAGVPAEIFNLRPDAYIWAATRASATGRVQTVYTQELPPRF